MELFRPDGALPDDLDDAVLVLALDGWTDAGQGGTQAADQLLAQLPFEPLGHFDSDRLYDYRDRRPLLAIDEGMLADPEWPSLGVWHLAPTVGPDLVLVSGAEPDFSWQTLCDELAQLCQQLGVGRYVGLGAVPGPVPHTRPVRMIATSSDEALLERMGRPHERVIVPASCQVVVEAAMRDAGLQTLGLWARIPHYVAGEFPAGAQTLLQRLGEHLGLDVDATVFDGEVLEHRTKLDVAAAASPEITEHISQLEESYDADVPDDGGLTGPLPTGDQIAAELERFLRDETDGA